ncbi:MAG: glutamate--tRNA ligase, partial [Alphaproteobacteria bacterium]|nr:glutamate--tRNA ligase [Alphaproteobacteria bacterium]
MTIITRFAPSPTGHLHIGNVRTALHNWLWAKKHGGQFLLRIDDTDLERSREEYVDGLQADLRWLGLNWDGLARQSARFALYEARFEELKAKGRVYACYETPEELELRRKVLLGRGLPPVYERKDPEAPVPEGRTPHWRFKLDHDTPIRWTDMIRGDQQFDPKLLSDPVIRRADGSWLYMLPSAIDDVDMGVTHVVRGEDHVTNTATQIQMFAALGAPAPQFAHEALLTGSEGKLSKRLGSLGMAELRDQGIEPMAILALLARLGTSQPVEPVTETAPLIAGIDFGHFGRAPARFDEAELAQLNAKILHQTDFAAVSNRLPSGMDEAGWTAIRPNIEKLADAESWWSVATGDVSATLAAEDKDYVAQAISAAENLDWENDPWHALTNTLKELT